VPVQKPAKHGRDHSPGGEDPIPGGIGLWEIKVFEDDQLVVAGDGAWYWPVPDDLDGAEIVYVDAGVSTPSSSGTIELMVAHEPGGTGPFTDILSTGVAIAAGDKNASPGTVDGGAWLIANGDWLKVDVDAAGSGAMGLSLMVGVTPSPLGSTIVRGAKGDPGGIVAWQGAFDGGATYATNDAVTINGSTYVATQPSTGVIPGVTPGWEDFWQLLAEGNRSSSIEIVINGNGFVLDVGVKGYVEVPFDCTISKVTMLADQSGDVVVDVWKTDYPSHPPLDSDSITGGNEAQIVAAAKSQDSTLTGWTTSITAGDILAFNIDSCSNIQRLTVSLEVER
jgi:hypothetical protein